ncbi:MAG: hypothetical protein GEV09_06185 [Pseudonocardiaceae bacterium]|nr:hypothetical protein [Pseudonocardiaceae bacterium]
MYRNFLDGDDQHRVPDAFTPDAFRRLTELQHRYDPDGVFQHHPGPAGPGPGP